MVTELPQPTSTTARVFDLIVVGAGINGLGIARDAAARGLSVALVEKDDFCSGVSAWSGRLIHGGLRYLEHGEVALVRESLRERERLFRLAPHLVKPVSLLMPFYKRNKRPSWLIRMGMIAYDVLSFDKKSPSHKILSTADVTARFSGMEKSGLGGSALFTDGQVEYAERLCVELAVAARADGALILTHSEVTELVIENGQATGVRYTDLITGEAGKLRGRVVMNAAGPWVDWLLGNPSDASLAPAAAKRHIGGSKGTHIVVDPFPGAPTDVVYYESQSDQRLVLVIPWMGRFLIGCTDTLFNAEPDSARATVGEVDYLLTEANALMPNAGLTRESVLFTYSGVRPLPYAPGIPEWKIPRSHIIFDHKKENKAKLFSIISGKLTTYRQLAEDAVNIALRDLGRPKSASPTRGLPFPGASTDNFASFRAQFLSTKIVEADTAVRLIDMYGTRAEQIVALVQKDGALGERFDPSSPAIAAELLFAIDSEAARTMTDVFARRILLAFEPDHGLLGAARAAEILGGRLGWSAEEQEKQIAEYAVWLDHLAVPASISGASAASPVLER